MAGTQVKRVPHTHTLGILCMAVAPEHPLVTPGSEVYNVPEKWPSLIQDSWRGEKPKSGIRDALNDYVSRAQQKSANKL